MQSHAEHSAVKWASFFSSIMRTEPLMNRHSETSLLLQLVRARVSKHATRVLNWPFKMTFVIQKSH